MWWVGRWGGGGGGFESLLTSSDEHGWQIGLGLSAGCIPGRFSLFSAPGTSFIT